MQTVPCAFCVGPLLTCRSLLWAQPESAAAPSAQPPSCRGGRSSLQTRRARNGLLTPLVCTAAVDGSPPSRRVKRAHFLGPTGAR